MQNTRTNFVRKKENFICDNCKMEVMGDGYTNHCPNCLYSKHVDLNFPGDRLNNCRGLMEPIGIEKVSGDWKIIQRCKKCNTTFRCKTASTDNKELLISLSLNSEV